MISLIVKWYARNRTYRKTYKELSSLTVHQLKDLGLHYSSIDQIAFEAAYGKEARGV
jgi:uncharacterized protein YjiS (DUF1127 family)